MPYRAHIVTTEWTELPDTVEGTRYTLQNLGSGVVYVTLGAAQPDADTYARGKLLPSAVAYPKPETGEKVWVRIPSGGLAEQTPVSYIESD